MNYKETQKAAILVLGKRKDIAIARCWKEVFLRLFWETYLNRRAPFCFLASMCNSEGSWERIPSQSFPCGTRLNYFNKPPRFLGNPGAVTGGGKKSPAPTNGPWFSEDDLPGNFLGWYELKRSSCSTNVYKSVNLFPFGWEGLFTEASFSRSKVGSSSEGPVGFNGVFLPCEHWDWGKMSKRRRCG